MGDLSMKLYHFSLLLALPALLFAGQTDSLSIIERSLPILNGHYFIPNTSFPSPFMTSFFETGIGGGTSLNSIPVYINDGTKLLGTLEGQNTYVTADVNVQIRAKEWMAVWFRYQANARIGSSTPTVFAHGVTSITGFEFGWMLRLWHGNKSQLTGAISINNRTVNAINLVNFIRDMVDNPDSIQTTLTKKKNPLDGGVGIRYAYAFNESIGIQGYINASNGESLVTDNRNVWRFDTGILGSLNLRRRYDIPIGFNLGYTVNKYTVFEDQDGERVKSFIFKVAYTGREEYNLGLEFTHINTVAPLIKGENKLEYISTIFTMVYFF